MTAGPEFGHMQGKMLVIKKALYGLKSSGAAFRASLAERLDDIGFKSSIADPDVWMRPAVKVIVVKNITSIFYVMSMMCYVCCMILCDLWMNSDHH